MADPRIEDGHIDIANELGEAFARTYFKPNESKVLWVILRKTYGWHKKTDAISYSQFEESTGIDRWNIAKILKGLISRNIITCNYPGLNRIIEYGVQKDYEKWKVLLDLTIDENVETIVNPVETIVNPVETIVNPDNKTIINPNIHKNKIHITKAITKAIYGKFKNVTLSQKEYQKLVDNFTELGAKERIEKLSEGIASHGYKYKSHYATILTWERMKQERNNGGANKNWGRPQRQVKDTNQDLIESWGIDPRAMPE
jgi:phage replication O-like protein O